MRAFQYADALAHFLLNLNPDLDMPTRSEDLGKIAQFIKDFCTPRRFIPKHQRWSRHKAATFIQKWVRGWLVRKRPDVQELRCFWRTMRGIEDPNRQYLPKVYESDSDTTVYLDSVECFNKPPVDEEEPEITLSSPKEMEMRDELMGNFAREECSCLSEPKEVVYSSDSVQGRSPFIQRKDMSLKEFVCKKPELSKEDAKSVLSFDV